MSLEQLRRDWDELGARDPLRAFPAEPGKRGRKRRETEFFATGETQIGDDIQWTENIGVAVPGGRALDFGCGAGRLSNALARRFDEVVGVDIAAPVLGHARRLDRSGGRIRYVHNTTPDLRNFGDGEFDLVYTDRVLQHLPPVLARRCLREMLRVTRSGGVLIIGVPDGAVTRTRGMIAALVPNAVRRLVQRHILRFPAPMRMHAIGKREIGELVTRAGGTLCATRLCGSDTWWRYVRHVVVKEPRHPGEPVLWSAPAEAATTHARR